jgi:regulator of protease activity HflC (stomatin/prohibitin superfamily)
MRVVVSDRETAILFRNGRYVGVLPTGVHWFANPFIQVDVKKFRKVQWVSVARVDALTAEKFPLRLAVGGMCQIVDANLADENEYLTQVQLALSGGATDAAAKVGLETILASRDELARKIEAAVVDSAPGCKLSSVRVASVALPPEVRRLFTDVERARREGQAALERARGEQAALRMLANAARMLKGNPELMNLRMLQAVGGEGKPGTLVLGSDALAASSRDGGENAAKDKPSRVGTRPRTSRA